MRDKYIIKPFNSVYLTTTALYAVFLFVLIQLLSGLDESKKALCVVLFCLLALVVFYLYKKAISVDEEYFRMYGFDEFNWLNELPLNVCNIVLIFAPIGILFNNQYLMSMSFFASVILSPMAILMPCMGFEKYSIFVPRVFGFYLTHYMAISTGILMYVLGLFKPSLSQIPVITCMMFGLSIVIYLINKYMRIKNLNPAANYFYNVDPEDNPVLQMCYKLIPHEFFFMMPVYALFIIICTLLTFIL